MCTTFADFFHSKITSLKQTVTVTAATLGRPLADPVYTGPELDRFPSVQPQSILKIINSIKPKTSAADFIPTSLFKSCSGVFFQKLYVTWLIYPFPKVSFPRAINLHSLLRFSKNLAQTPTLPPITDQYLMLITFPK